MRVVSDCFSGSNGLELMKHIPLSEITGEAFTGGLRKINESPATYYVNRLRQEKAGVT
ncbi:MAG: hypothetical protein Q9M97_07055 [Candidatus Gracilibacteria bacterium]|nr:hypothetical protein [Candidatus Gracilibacteria bacterium]